MDIQTFSQLGMGTATLLILWYVVKYFIKTLTKKDKDFHKVIKRFNHTINNHIVHETEQAEKQTLALKGLTRAIGNLVKEAKK